MLGTLGSPFAVFVSVHALAATFKVTLNKKLSSVILLIIIKIHTVFLCFKFKYFCSIIWSLVDLKFVLLRNKLKTLKTTQGYL